jgi:hypothetical protein
MTEAGPPSQQVAIVAAAKRLRIDAATAEVLAAFAAHGVEALVLKGASLTDWIYAGDEAHSYMDSDLLVRPGDEPAARGVLAELGFVLEQDDSTLPDWWREHATEWRRPADQVWVDLHRAVLGIGVDATTAWDELASTREQIPIAGFAAPTLAAPGRLVHVVLHAAQHGADWAKATAHVERALAVLDEPVWRSAAELAARLEAVDSFAAGLRLVPEGAVLADGLGLPHVRSVEVALRATTAPPVALGFEQLAKAGTMRARAAIVWHKLVPPREFIVHWYPWAATSRRALAGAYLRRPLWVLRRAPRGFRAWRRARREVRGR